MKKTNISTMIVIAAAHSLLLTACGSSKEANNADFASRNLPATNQTTSTVSSQALAYCSQGQGQVIKANLKAFTDSTNTLRKDYVWVRLKSIPSDFSSDNSYIAFWKWMAITNGSTYLDSNVLKYALYNASTGQALTDWKSSLRWSDISSLMSSMGVSDAQGFFNNVSILVDLKDVQGEYDALKISNYAVSTNQAVTDMDTLLPFFAANPSEYALEASGNPRANILKSLHPFASLADKGFTTSQFQSMSNDFCF